MNIKQKSKQKSKQTNKQTNVNLQHVNNLNLNFMHKPDELEDCFVLLLQVCMLLLLLRTKLKKGVNTTNLISNHCNQFFISLM